jgi:hypothetical protein
MMSGATADGSMLYPFQKVSGHRVRFGITPVITLPNT